jgi:hypothetical protein
MKASWDNRDLAENAFSTRTATRIRIRKQERESSVRKRITKGCRKLEDSEFVEAVEYIVSSQLWLFNS